MTSSSNHVSGSSHPADPVAPMSRQGGAVRYLRPLARLVPFVAPYRARVGFALLALVGAAAATLAVPQAVRQMIDIGFSHETREQVAGAFYGLLVIIALLALFSAARFYFVSWLGERIVADLRGAVFAHLTRMSPVFFETAKTGEVLSRLTADTTVIQGVVGVNASIALRNLVMLVGGVALMFATNAWLSFLFLISGPGVILPILLIGRRVRSLSRASQDRIADTSALAGEAIQAMSTVQAFGREAHERTRFSKAVEAAFDTAARRILIRAGLTAAAIFIASAAVVAVLWYGAEQVMAERASAGSLVQFIIYAVLVAGSIGALGEVWGEFQRAAGATERLMELLDLRPQISSPPQPIDLPADKDLPIAFKGVCFSYPTRTDTPALNGIDLTIEPGETVAFVGPSGAGKSTLFKLLLRFYDTTGGCLSIGGVPVDQADLQSLRDRMAFVAQEPVIFSGTVEENIAYGRIGAAQDDIVEAAKAAQADGFIRALPGAYQAMLGERGITLSGGQRQRIALARAFLKDAPILLLDEPTSALDSSAEADIQAALERLRKGRTCLIIAHRLSTVTSADRIIVLDEGRVVGAGTHEDLVSGGGLYADLAKLQVLDGEPGRSVRETTRLAGE